MSEPTKGSESMGTSKKEWRVNVSKDQPFEWKGESSSEYLWNEDLYKAHTSGTPSDTQVAVSGKDGAGDIDRDPQQLDLENSFNSGREMGSVTENPTVKPRMLNPKKKRGSGAKKIEAFSIKQENKKPHPRPINTPKGIPVSLLNKAISILSAPVDETDVADDIGILLKNWKGSGHESEDNFENTNWEPRERSEDNSVASVDPENKELEEGEAEEVDENLADVLSNEASKAVVDLAKKNMRVAKKISNEAVEEAEEQNTSDDLSRNTPAQHVARHESGELSPLPKKKPVMDNISLQKQLAMGHGRCPHKNQFDLCEKCGDMEMKQDDMGGEASLVEKGTRNVTRKVRRNLEDVVQDDEDFKVALDAFSTKPKTPKEAAAEVEDRRKLEAAAAKITPPKRVISKEYATKMGSLMKALEDVEVQLAVETNDYNGLVKALGSHIQKLSSR